jgi:hypothetical protein
VQVYRKDPHTKHCKHGHARWVTSYSDMAMLGEGPHSLTWPCWMSDLMLWHGHAGWVTSYCNMVMLGEWPHTLTWPCWVRDLIL